MTQSRYDRICQLLTDGKTVPETAYATGYSESTVNKIKNGRKVTIVPDPWCPACRTHVFAPCQTCRAQIRFLIDHDPQEQWKAELKAGVPWEAICRRDVLDEDEVHRAA